MMQAYREGDPIEARLYELEKNQTAQNSRINAWEDSLTSAFRTRAVADREVSIARYWALGLVFVAAFATIGYTVHLYADVEIERSRASPSYQSDEDRALLKKVHAAEAK